MKSCENLTDIGGNDSALEPYSESPCQTVDRSTIPRYRFGFEPTSCGYCDVNCVYDVIEICFIVGVVANSLVIARVARDKKLRDPTFVGIAALAFADLLFLVLNLTVAFETVIISLHCLEPVIVSRPWYVLNSMTWFAANSHVALLAILRFLTIAYPIRSSLFLTPRRVVYLSAGVWTLGIILMGSLSVLITFKIILPGTSGEFIIIWWITVYLIPLIVTSILHILKIFRVKRSTNESTTMSTRRSISRMSKIVPLVIVMATVLPLPKLIYNCLKATNSNVLQSKAFRIHFKGISQLVYLVNHFVNPFIYGFLSKKFRRSLKEMFQCMCHVCYDNSDEKTSHRSQKQRHISVVTVSTGIGSVSSLDSDVTSISPEPDYNNGRNYFGRSVSNLYHSEK